MDGEIQNERILKLELRLAQLEKNEECQNTFLSFVKKSDVIKKTNIRPWLQ